MNQFYHPYHLVDASPWPYIMSCSALLTTIGAVIYFHYKYIFILSLGVIFIALTLYFWCKDVVREATYQGHHTISTTQGLKLGFILFIVSEVFFFLSFFWAFFHSSLSPAVEIGMYWPPTDINPLNPFSIPLLNTTLLLSSGATITWAHHNIIKGNKQESTKALSLTIILGLFFTLLQAFEYLEAPFCIADSVYGSTFFVATGFHGLHVIIGTIFLMICLFRLIRSHFTKNHHLDLKLPPDTDTLLMLYDYFYIYVFIDGDPNSTKAFVKSYTTTKQER